jgi:putative transposase
MGAADIFESVLHVRSTFVTKYRRNVFTKAVLNDMRGIFGSVCQDFETSFAAMDGEDDHVRLRVDVSPKVAISKRVTGLKGVSSRSLRKLRPCPAQASWNGVFVLAKLPRRCFVRSPSHHPAIP